MAALAPDKSGYAVGLDADTPPESTWLYHNGGVQVVEPIFRATTGDTIEAYARANLWSKIGMTSASWSKDSLGHPTTYANVLATCRDHARLGYLMLRNGRWKTEQVVPADWVSAATTPSQPHNRGYGYLWWVNGEGPTITPTGSHSDAQLYDYAPADLFAARGFGGQFIDVIPSLDMVVVRFAKDPTSMISSNPSEILASLVADENSDDHRAILSPILAGTH
jgi:CubicO group peptidase (beta-lactamase class C family)